MATEQGNERYTPTGVVDAAREGLIDAVVDITVSELRQDSLLQLDPSEIGLAIAELKQSRRDLRKQLENNDVRLRADSAHFVRPRLINSNVTPLFDRSEVEATACEANLLPLSSVGAGVDGPFTVAAYSSDRHIVSTLAEVDELHSGTTSMNSFFISARPNSRMLVDRRNTPPGGETGTVRNVITLLTWASIKMRLRTDNANGGKIIVTEETALVSTPHIVELAGDNTVGKRKYDIVPAKKVKIVNADHTVRDGPTVRTTSPMVNKALAVLKSVMPDEWLMFFGDLQAPGGYNDSIIDGSLLRAALGMLVGNDLDRRMLVAEAAAACGSIVGMSDEARMEQTGGRVTACISEACLIDLAARPITASDVMALQASGIMTAEANYTRLLSQVSRQTSYNENQRVEHLRNALRAGFPIDYNFSDKHCSVSISMLFACTFFVTQNVSGQRKACQVDSVLSGHTLLEPRHQDTSVPENVRDTRQMLVADTTDGTLVRRQYTSMYGGSSTYAHSVDTDEKEYVSGAGEGGAMNMNNIVAARATGGAINALVTWLDGNAVVDGTDRAMVALYDGVLMTSESRLCTLATELKRFGIALRLSENRIAGVSNARRDYSFTNNSHALVAASFTATGQKLGVATQRSDFTRIVSTLVAQEAKTWAYLSSYRQLNSVVVTAGIVNDPKVLYGLATSNDSLICATNTYSLSADRLWEHRPTMITSSSLHYQVNKPGGFSVKRLIMDAPAASYSIAGYQLLVSGECAELGLQPAALMNEMVTGGAPVQQAELHALMGAAVGLCADEDLVAYTWGTSANLQKALTLYEQPLNKYAKRSAERIMWHACTGFTLLMHKLSLAKALEHEVLPSDLNPLPRLMSCRKRFAAYGPGELYALSVMLAADAKWANGGAIVHTVMRAIYHYPLLADSEVEDALATRLSAPLPRRRNRTCRKGRGACLQACYAHHEEHWCRRCKVKYECRWCEAADKVILNGRPNNAIPSPIPQSETTINYEVASHRQWNEAITEDSDIVEGMSVSARCGDRSDLRNRVTDLASNTMDEYLLSAPSSAKVRPKPIKLGNLVDMLANDDSVVSAPSTPAAVIAEAAEQASAGREGVQHGSAEHTVEAERSTSPGRGGENEVDDWAAKLQEEGIDNSELPENQEAALNRMLAAPKRINEWGSQYSDESDSEVDVKPKFLQLPMSDVLGYSGRLPKNAPPGSELPKCLVDCWEKERDGVNHSHNCKREHAHHYHCANRHTCGFVGEYTVRLRCDQALVPTEDDRNYTEPEPRLGLDNLSISDVTARRLGCERLLKERACGRNHSVLHEHWCLTTNMPNEQESVRRALLPYDSEERLPIRGAVGEPRNDRDISVHLFRDLTNLCRCTGCEQVREFGNKDYYDRVRCDAPVWHYDLSEVRQLKLHTNAYKERYWGDTARISDMPDDMTCTMCWLAAISGYFYRDYLQTRVFQCGDCDLWAEEADNRELLVEGKLYTVADLPKQKDYNTANHIHAMMQCGVETYRTAYGSKGTPRPPPSAQVVFVGDSAKLEVRMQTLVRLVHFMLVMWDIRGQTARRMEVVRQSGAVIGDMHHYEMRRRVKNGELLDIIELRVASTCNTTAKKPGPRTIVSKETANAVEAKWGKATRAMLVEE